MKINIQGIIIALALVGVAFYGGTIGQVIAGLAFVGIAVSIIKNTQVPKIFAVVGIIAVVLISGVIGTVLPSGGITVPTASVSTTQQVTASAGQDVTAILNIISKADQGGVFVGTGPLYAIAPSDPAYSLVNNRYDLMKLASQNKLTALQGKTLTLTTGTHSNTGFNAKIGDKIKVFGYQDATPAAAENVSWYKEITLTGLTSGSTPAWMTSDGTVKWGSYAQMISVNPTTDGASNGIFKNSTVAQSGKSFEYQLRPVVDGQHIENAAIYVQASDTASAYITSIKVTAPNGVTSEVTGLQEVTTGSDLFNARPGVNSSASYGGAATDNIYFGGYLPDGGNEGIRSGTTQPGAYTVKVTYDHPASGNVSMLIHAIQNVGALTTTGGHIDSSNSAAVFNFTMNAAADVDRFMP